MTTILRRKPQLLPTKVLCSACFRTSTKHDGTLDPQHSILNMNQSLKQVHPSNTDDKLKTKWQKYSAKDDLSASDASDEDGDDLDAELQGLCGTEANKTSKDKPCARLEQSDSGNDLLLSDIAEDLLNADESGPAAEKQLVDFIYNQWSKKLPDSKLKDKSATYLRPPNWETLATPLTLKSGIK